MAPEAASFGIEVMLCESLIKFYTGRNTKKKHIKSNILFLKMHHVNGQKSKLIDSQ